MDVRSFLAFNPSRYYLHRFLLQAAHHIQPGESVLDAGAGDTPYKALFAHTRYTATDRGLAYQTTGLDYLSDMTALPIRSESYDHIICTQVMEHIPEPGEMLAEFYRLLKPGGRLWLSAPLFYPEHQTPYDYYRYTQYGLRYLHEKAGFAVERIEALEGLFGVLAYQCQKGALWLPSRKIADVCGAGCLLLLPVLVAARAGFAFLSVLFAHLDKYARIDRDGYCKNYTVVARKPKTDGGVADGADSA